MTLGLPGSDVLAARHARVRSALEAKGLEALIVTTPANIRYLANHIGTAGTLLMSIAVLLTVYSLWLYVSRYGRVFVESRARS